MYPSEKNVPWEPPYLNPLQVWYSHYRSLQPLPFSINFRLLVNDEFGCSIYFTLAASPSILSRNRFPIQVPMRLMIIKKVGRTNTHWLLYFEFLICRLAQKYLSTYISISTLNKSDTSRFFLFSSENKKL